MHISKSKQMTSRFGHKSTKICIRCHSNTLSTITETIRMGAPKQKGTQDQNKWQKTVPKHLPKLYAKFDSRWISCRWILGSIQFSRTFDPVDFIEPLLICAVRRKKAITFDEKRKKSKFSKKNEIKLPAVLKLMDQMCRFLCKCKI